MVVTHVDIVRTQYFFQSQHRTAVRGFELLRLTESRGAFEQTLKGNGFSYLKNLSGTHFWKVQVSFVRKVDSS